MAARAFRLCAALSALMLGIGCGSLSSYTARPDDYAAYRATRVAPSVEGRIQAAATYLERFPKGEFEPEVRAYFERAEPIFLRDEEGEHLGPRALRPRPSGGASQHRGPR